MKSLITILFLSSAFNLFAQLSAGSIAITSVNTDGTDGLSFVVLNDIAQGTKITFDESDHDGSGQMTGSGGKITITFNCYVSAGTVIAFDANGNFVNGFSDGTIELDGVFSLTGSDEFIWVYQGDVSTNPLTFITAVANDNFPTSGTNSLGSTGLSSGTNAWEYDITGSPDEDIMRYIGSNSGQTLFSDYLSLINGHNASNWESQDGTGDQSNDGIAPDFATGGSALGYQVPSTFTITTSCTTPNTPGLSTNPKITNVSGSITPNGTSTGYMLVRYPSGSSITAPSNGTFHCLGASLGAGTVVSFSNSLSFFDYGLDPSTTYDYYAYAFNSNCNGQPFYSSPSTVSSATTSASIVSINTNSAAFAPATTTSRNAAADLNNTWESNEQATGVGCSSGWSTVYGSLSFTNPTGSVTGLVQTDLSTQSNGNGTTYTGTVLWTLRNFDIDPDNSLTATITDLGTIGGGSISSTGDMQDGAPLPTGLSQDFTHSTLATAGRSGVRFTFSDPVKSVGFFVGDMETTTANNGSDPYTPAIVVVYDATNTEIERQIVPTATSGGNCVSQTTSYAGSNSCAIGCGSGETVWIGIQSSTNNISRIEVIVGDYVDQDVTSTCPSSGTSNAGSDRGNNEYLSFAGFTLGGNCTTPVPVELINFNAKASGNNAFLNWSTAFEHNSEKFIIQKSIDEYNFENIGEIGSVGFSNDVNNYQFNDENYNGITSFYRLKQIDFDGQTDYSWVRKLSSQMELTFIDLNIVPNPTGSHFTIQTKNTSLKRVDIVNILGEIVMSIETQETNSIKLNATDLLSGVYQVIAHSRNGSKAIKKLLIQK